MGSTPYESLNTGGLERHLEPRLKETRPQRRLRRVRSWVRLRRRQPPVELVRSMEAPFRPARTTSGQLRGVDSGRPATKPVSCSATLRYHVSSCRSVA